MGLKISGAEEIINRIADEVSETVEGLGGGQECEICRNNFTDYSGSCLGYSWSLSHGKSGYWDFELKIHGKEICSTRAIEGSISHILLKALKVLNSGEWRNK